MSKEVGYDRFLNPLYVAPDAGRSVADTTAMLQRAIDTASERNGTVIVAPGEYEVTTVVLRSNITIHLCRGAVLRACGDIEQYPEYPAWPGVNSDRQRYYVLYADACENVTIEGEGAVDGNGQAFWDPPFRTMQKQGHTRESLGLREHVEDDSPFWRERARRPSPMVELRHCRNVTLRDVTFRNSPGWTVHPYFCDDVTIRGITIDDNLYGPNTDGIDVNGCRDVVISDCSITCGDDAIILKSTVDSRSCERVVVSNCILATNCAAIGLGAEVTYAIRDVVVTNCVVKQALRIVQLEMWEAGCIENVVISNITGANMTDIPLERPIYLDIQQHGRSDPALGTMRNITISGLTCRTRGRIVMTAQDGATIENVTLRDITLEYPDIEDPEISVTSSRSSQMSNYNPESRSVRAAVVADNVDGLVLENVVTRWPSVGGPQIEAQGDEPDTRFNGDIRKQRSVFASVPMHAFFARRSRNVYVNSPRLTANDNAGRIETIESSVVVYEPSEYETHG